MIIPSLGFNCVPETMRAAQQEMVVHVGVDRFLHISFALKDILLVCVLAVSCITLGYLGRKGRLKIAWPPAFCLCDHPSSGHCPCGVEADFSP